MKISPAALLKDMSSFFPMVCAILRGQYKMPWNTFFWAVLCLIYVLSPIDLLPDVLPVLGITDDGAFILLVLSMLHNNLADFRHWQKTGKTILEAEVVRPQDDTKK